MEKQYCIFDMDGTLVDSMGYWHSLTTDFLDQYGISPVPGQLEAIAPMTMLESARYFMDTFGLAGPPEHMVDEFIAIMGRHYRRDVPLKPGVSRYLTALRETGVRLCVATATAGPLAHACLSRLGVDRMFEFLLSGESVGAGKDRPDLYLAAARRLDAAPADIAVFEDALFAATTARQAGFYTVGVYDRFQGHVEQMRALCDEYITDWREVCPS
jgi:HAD superfamily hydrolase (TIGR01509 family)